jgi:hypothetical protein
MTAALTLAAAQTNAVGLGGVLTLIFPLVLLPIIVAIWVVWWMLRSRNYP